MSKKSDICFETIPDLTHRFGDIVNLMSDMLIITTLDLKIALVNQATINVLGYKTADELIGASLETVLNERPGLKQETSIRECLIKCHHVSNQETIYKTKYGTDVTVIFSAVVILDTSGKPKYIICVSQNISKQKITENKIAYMTTHDILTNLPNYVEFKKVLTVEMARAKRHKRIIALLFIDLNNFKHINDSYGHPAGDMVLLQVTERLRASIRQEDIVVRFPSTNPIISRLSDDEFVMLLTDLKQDMDAAIYANRVVSIFSKPFRINDLDVYVNINIGISVAHTANITSDDFIKNANIAMSRAKETGQNNIEFFTESLSFAYKRRIVIESGLHLAIDKSHFYLAYQPQYDLKTGCLRGIEALLRWVHPTLGFISPVEFILAAETSNFIIPLGEWVLRHACQQYHTWCSHGIVSSDLKLAINISPNQLVKGSFIYAVDRILKETNVKPSSLEFEITETALMTEMESSEKILREIQQIGISIAIDDFGSGYSSLTRIKSLPVNILKIDKSFIKKVLTNKNDAIIVKSIIALANVLELVVIAEGVEKEDQAAYLIKNGCHIAQGYYFSKPVSAEKFVKLLKSKV